ISLSFAREILPTLTLWGSADPDSRLRAFLIRTAAGGVFVMNEKVLSAYTVMTTGRIRPGSTFFVASLNCWTNCGADTPWGPSAGPTGGAGVALPAGHCSLTMAVIFFLAINFSPFVVIASARGGLPTRRALG